ncbi:MAG: OmpA family protein [Desulfomonilaceae bacterium]
MKRILKNIAALTLIALLAGTGRMDAHAYLAKKHDFLPRHSKVLFVVDVSAMMNQECADTGRSRLSVALGALKQFVTVVPSPPLWQYPFMTSLVAAGDPKGPSLMVPLQIGTLGVFDPYYELLMAKRPFHPRVSSLGEALELCANMAVESPGRTAVVVFTDGETCDRVAQLTAQALKHELGDDFSVFGVFVGDAECGWKNLTKLCGATGGYVRSWRDVLSKEAMRDFVWDILVQEIAFHYIEVFFRENSADLLPSEAGKLADAAAFLQLIPPYELVIDGYSIPAVEARQGRRLALKRAEVIKSALARAYGVNAQRIKVRSMGSAYPRYKYDDPAANLQNAEAVVYLRLPLRNVPYDEKHLHTFGQPVTGRVFNDRERQSDEEWAWPASWPSRSVRQKQR